MTHTYKGFDPSSDRWEYIWLSRGRQGGNLRELIELLFRHAKVSDSYSKAKVLDAWTKYGYFAFGKNVIYYIPFEGESSLEYMGGQ